MNFIKKNLQQTSSLFKRQTASQHDVFDDFLHKCSSIAYENLTSNKNSNHDLVEFASSVAAPFLFFYTLWILETAKKNKIRNLYFLSRDGQILYYIAKIIIDKKEDYTMNCHYLYASRQLWHLPSIDSSIGDDELEWILQGNNNDFNTILKKVDLKYSAVKKYAQRFNFEADTKIGSLEIQDIKKFFREPDVLRMIVIKARKQREILLKYFEQELFLSNNNLAIIDLGWHGNLQKSLRKILDITYKNNTYLIHGFYLNLIRDNTSKQDKTFVFLKNQTVDMQMAIIAEYFASADHNSVIGLQIKDDSVLPRFAKTSLHPLITWGIKDWHKSILEYSTILVEADFTFIYTDILANKSIKKINIFYENPKKSYLNVLSTYPYSYAQDEKKIGYIVKNQDIHYLLYLLKIKKKYTPDLWWKGSFYINSPLYKLLFYPLYFLKEYKR